MFAYCALGITCDFIYGNFFKISYDYVYIYIIYLINEVMVYCYLKYMMDKLYLLSLYRNPTLLGSDWSNNKINDFHIYFNKAI